MKTLYPSVVTSKVAQNHYDDIKVKHDDILKGMQIQNMKVDNFNMMKGVENDKLAQNDMVAQKEKNESQLKRQEIDQKNRELEIKRLALTS